jgi:hypothetical protein
MPRPFMNLLRRLWDIVAYGGPAPMARPIPIPVQPSSRQTAGR